MKRTVFSIAVLALTLGLVGCTSGDAEPEVMSTPEVVSTTEAASTPETSSTAEESQATDGTSLNLLSDAPTSSVDAPDPNELESLGLNDRGNLDVEEEAPAVFRDLDHGTEFAAFTANNVTANFECTADDAPQSINGQFVALDFDIEAYEELAKSGFPYFYLSVHEFRAWDAEGESVIDPVGNAEACITEDERVPSPIDPGEHQSGLVVLDMPEGAGSASFTLGGFQGSYGWEWSW